MGRSVPGINNRYVSGTVSQVADDFRSWPALAKVLGPAPELPNAAGACLAHLVAAAAGGLVHLPVAVQGVQVVALKLCRHRGELGDGVPAALLAGCRGKGYAIHTLDSAWKVGRPSSLPPCHPLLRARLDIATGSFSLPLNLGLQESCRRFPLSPSDSPRCRAVAAGGARVGERGP